MNICETCWGTGIIITCLDNICVGSGHCIHGDGEEICPDCEGEGEVFDPNENDWDDYLDWVAEEVER